MSTARPANPVPTRVMPVLRRLRADVVPPEVRNAVGAVPYHLVRPVVLRRGRGFSGMKTTQQVALGVGVVEPSVAVQRQPEGCLQVCRNRGWVFSCRVGTVAHASAAPCSMHLHHATNIITWACGADSATNTLEWACGADSADGRGRAASAAAIAG